MILFNISIIIYQINRFVAKSTELGFRIYNYKGSSISKLCTYKKSLPVYKTVWQRNISRSLQPLPSNLNHSLKELSSSFLKWCKLNYSCVTREKDVLNAFQYVFKAMKPLQNLGWLHSSCLVKTIYSTIQEFKNDYTGGKVLSEMLTFPNQITLSWLKAKVLKCWQDL